MTDPNPAVTVPLRVILQDLRTVRYCLPGARPWFRRHGFDWQAFLTDGIEATRLQATGDALVDPVIRAAERRVAERRVAAGSLPAPREAQHGRP